MDGLFVCHYIHYCIVNSNRYIVSNPLKMDSFVNEIMKFALFEYYQGFL